MDQRAAHSEERIKLSKTFHASSNIFDRFPLEITSYVFQLCLDTPEVRGEWTRADRMGPLVFGSVCISWRSIAWNEPRLWKTIFVSLPSLNVRQHEELIQDWFTRSKNTSLALIVELYYPGLYNSLEEEANPILVNISKSSLRWISLDVGLHPTSPSPDFSDEFEHLSRSLNLLLGSKTSPSLKKLTCDFWGIGRPILSLIPSFSKVSFALQELTVEQMTGYDDEWITALGGMPYLTKLAMISHTRPGNARQVTDKFLKALIGTDESRPLLPLLRVFAYEGPLTFTWHGVVALADHLQSPPSTVRMSRSAVAKPPSIRIDIVGFSDAYPYSPSLEHLPPALTHLFDSGFDIGITMEELQGDDGWIALDLLHPPEPVDISSKNMNPPRYPPAAFRAGIQGEVILIIDVDANGNVTNVSVEKSSRNRDLDRAAMEAARKWKFNPAQSGGTKAAGRVRVPVNFALS